IPVIRRLALPKPRVEHGVWIMAPAALAQRVLVIDPGIDDDPLSRVIAKEQAEATEELRAPPMPVLRAERVAESKRSGARIARYLDLNEVDDALEQLRLGMLRVATRIDLA